MCGSVPLTLSFENAQNMIGLDMQGLMTAVLITCGIVLYAYDQLLAVTGLCAGSCPCIVATRIDTRQE